MWQQQQEHEHEGVDSCDVHINQAQAEELAHAVDEGDIFRGQLFECWSVGEWQLLTGELARRGLQVVFEDVEARNLGIVSLNDRRYPEVQLVRWSRFYPNLRNRHGIVLRPAHFHRFHDFVEVN